MKIMICGSMSFAKEMIEAQKKLEKLGHSVLIPVDSNEIANKEHNHDDLEADYKHCVEKNILERCHKLIEQSDAILVLNYEKNNIKGYIGACTLMDIAITKYLKKKLFLLYPPPHHNEQRWAHEIRILQPTILNGNLKNLK